MVQLCLFLGQVGLIRRSRKRYISKTVKVISGRLEPVPIFAFDSKFAQKRAALALWVYSHISKKKLFPKRNIKKRNEVRPVGIDSGVTSVSGVEPEQVAQQVVASPSSARSQHRFSTGWVAL